MAAARDDDEIRVQLAMQLGPGAQADGDVAIAPDEQDGFSADAADGHAELGHFGEPAAQNAEHVTQRTGIAQAVDDLAEAAVEDAVWAAIEFSERDALETCGEIRQCPCEQPAPRRAVEADHGIGGAAERIGRSEEDEAANSPGIERSEHEGDGSAVRMSDDVGLGQVEGVHDGGDAPGRGVEPRVEAADALRAAHVDKIDGVDAGVLGEGRDDVAPVCAGADEAMDEEHRRPTAGVEVKDASSGYIDEPFFESDFLGPELR